MTKNDRSKVDWTKPLEFLEPPGFWVPCNLVYESDKLMIVVYTVGDREYEVTLDAKKKSDPLKNFRNKKESRAVPKDKWLDLTKPLEAFDTDTGKADLSDVVFIGPMADNSRNFPSWFICKWDSTRARELGFAGLDEGSYFLMRGDGKTDIPGLTVRNKTEGFADKAAPRLQLPIKERKVYRHRDGSTCYIGLDFRAGKADGWDNVYDYDKNTGLNIHGFTHLDLVEGPL